MPTRNLVIIALVVIFVPTASALGFSESDNQLVLDLDVAQLALNDDGAWIDILGQHVFIPTTVTVATAAPYLGLDPLAPSVSTPGLPAPSSTNEQDEEEPAAPAESAQPTPWARPSYDGPAPRVLCAPRPTSGPLALGILPRACIPLALDIPLDAPVVDAPGGGTVTTTSAATPTGAAPETIPEVVAEELPLAAIAGVFLVAAASSGASIFTLLFERLRRFAFLAVLYTRLTPDRILDHGVRDNLFEALKARPGTAISDLAKATDIPRNTATHHLHMLEKQGLVTSTRQGRVRLYFPTGSGAQRRSADALAALRHDTTSALAREIGREPGLDQGALGDRFGLKPSLTHWHVGRLVESGIVQQVRDGRRVRYYPGDAFHRVMNEGMRGPGV